MKKSLFMLGTAAMMLASCTQNEVMEVAENRAIGFNAFVNNTTKAATEFTGSASSADIYVIGYYGDNNGTLDKTVFQNELGSSLYYWNESKDYIFGAYADGKAGKFDNVSFSSSDAKLTFTNYTPSTKDLVAAVSDKVQNVTAATQGKVQLSFKHMLAQVGFTFNTQVGEGYTLAISNIQIEKAIQTATGTYTASDIDWQGSTTGDGVASYTYTDITDLANGTTNSNSEYNLVIPQTVSGIKVTFTASISGVGIDPAKTREIEVTLPATTVTKWEAGNKYNYTTTINAEDITDELKPIEFDVQTIPDWEEGGSETITVPAA